MTSLLREMSKCTVCAANLPHGPRLVLAGMNDVQPILLIGQYAQARYLGVKAGNTSNCSRTLRARRWLAGMSKRSKARVRVPLLTVPAAKFVLPPALLAGLNSDKNVSAGGRTTTVAPRVAEASARHVAPTIHAAAPFFMTQVGRSRPRSLAGRAPIGRRRPGLGRGLVLIWLSTT
jgi:hypothetical protein